MRNVTLNVCGRPADNLLTSVWTEPEVIPFVPSTACSKTQRLNVTHFSYTFCTQTIHRLFTNFSSVIATLYHIYTGPITTTKHI